MSEKRVPYWEFMRRKDVRTPSTDKKNEIDELNEMVEKLRNDIKRVEELLESHGIKRT